MKADYNNKKSKLIKRFNKSLNRYSHLLSSTFGNEKGNDIVSDAQEEYIKLIPHIPYIGTRNPMLLFLLPTIRYLAIYRTLLKHGSSTESAGQFIYDSAKIELLAIPKIIRRIINFLWFSSIFRYLMKKRAIITNYHKYEGDFIFSFIEGDSYEFDFGIDYHECANCKFLIAQNASELCPYICETDRIASELLGWGLIRTETISDGKDRCNFRFKKGGKTIVRGSSIQIKF